MTCVTRCLVGRVFAGSERVGEPRDGRCAEQRHIWSRMCGSIERVHPRVPGAFAFRRRAVGFALAPSSRRSLTRLSSSSAPRALSSRRPARARHHPPRDDTAPPAVSAFGLAAPATRAVSGCTTSTTTCGSCSSSTRFGSVLGSVRERGGAIATARRAREPRCLAPCLWSITQRDGSVASEETTVCGCTTERG